eukprot:5299437-Pleurochrysis_carterae.AAC.1
MSDALAATLASPCGKARMQLRACRRSASSSTGIFALAASCGAEGASPRAARAAAPRAASVGVGGSTRPCSSLHVRSSFGRACSDVSTAGVPQRTRCSTAARAPRSTWRRKRAKHTDEPCKRSMHTQQTRS